MNIPKILFEAYKGSEPYMFISYAHKDSDIVYPIIKDFYDMRYNIWYDEGIDPGNEWPEEIAKALEKCAFFIVFISCNSTNSRNVMNEINFALDENKPFLAIHIEETKLPSGLRLRTGCTQAIMKYKMEKESFLRKIAKIFEEKCISVRDVKEYKVNKSAAINNGESLFDKETLKAAEQGYKVAQWELDDADDGKPNVYDNSKDALACIMHKHGVEVLLGDSLKNFFTDYAPSIVALRKNVVFSVYQSGAASILKKNLTAKDSEKEIAFKQAVQKVIDTYGTERSLVESVILEFTDVLGWKIITQVHESPVQTHSPSPTPPKQKILSQIVQQPQPASAQKPIPPPQQQYGGLTAGQRNFQFGKYKWRVLDVKSGKALLLSEHIIETRLYHSAYSTTWAECELRGYLNGAFLQTFGSTEQNRIVQVTNTNENNQWYGTIGGNNTADKVFLLSIEEVVKYFGDSGKLRITKEVPFWINDQYNNARIANVGNGECRWWLRSPGSDEYTAAYVQSNGFLNISGFPVIGVVGVRPALWLNIDEK